MRSSIGIALLQAWIFDIYDGTDLITKEFFTGFFTQDEKKELNRGFWNRKILCFPIIISRQFSWKYWYVFGLCIDTVLLAFILSFIDVSVNRRSPNTHTCMTKVKQIYILVWLRKSRCTFVYNWRKGRYTYLNDWGKADIQTFIIYKVMKYRKILIKYNAYF